MEYYYTKIKQSVSLLGLTKFDAKVDDTYLKNVLFCYILYMYYRGKRCFVISPEEGFGLLAGETVIEAKAIYKDIDLLVIPHYGRIRDRYVTDEKKLKIFDTIIKNAVSVRNGLEEEHRHAFEIKNNSRIIEESSELILFYDSDIDREFYHYTKQAKEYAKNKEMPVHNLYPFEKKVFVDKQGNKEILNWIKSISRRLANKHLKYTYARPLNTMRDTDNPKIYKKEYLDTFDLYYTYYCDILYQIAFYDIIELPAELERIVRENPALEYDFSTKNMLQVKNISYSEGRKICEKYGVNGDMPNGIFKIGNFKTISHRQYRKSKQEFSNFFKKQS